MAARIALACTALLCLVLATPASACKLITATSITTNTTWGLGGSLPDSCYEIQNTITISGNATLTIEAGTVLKFDAGTSLIIGSGASAGMLVANGTSTSPVVFTSFFGSVGGWGGLDFADASDAGGASSTLAFAVVQLGGAGGFQVRVTNSNGVTLSDCFIHNHSGVGLNLNNAQVGVAGCTFQDWAVYPIYGSPNDVSVLSGAYTLVPYGTGARNAIELRGGGISQSLVLPTPPAGFCYISDGGDFNIGLNPFNPVVTIQPGTLMKMAGGRWLTGSGGADGGLFAKGVVFTSAKDDTLGDTNGDNATVPAPGDWTGITFEAQTILPASGLDSCIVRYAGGAGLGCGVRLDGSDPTVQDCLITLNLPNGLRAFGETTTAGNVVNNVLRANTQEQVYAEVHAMGNLVTGNTIVPSLNSKYNGYLLRGATISRTSVLPTPRTGFCYITDGTDLNIGVDPFNAVVTIQPGTVVKMAGGRWLTGSGGARGGLTAKGVVFTSAKDDTISDTNGDGTTVPSPGDWSAITFESQTLLPASGLDSCIVRYAGAAGFGCGVRLDGADPTVTRCLITLNLPNGLRAFGDTVSAAHVSNNVLRGNTQNQIYAEVHAMEHLVTANTIVPSGTGKYDGYLLHGATITRSSVLPTPKTGFCYISDGIDLNIGQEPFDPMVKIQPNTVVKMIGSRWLTGAGGAFGGLSAKGVLFTSAKDDTISDTNGDGVSVPGPGDWSAIAFEGQTLSGSALSCCVVEYAGGASFNCGVRMNGAGVSLAYTTITKCLGRGVFIANSASTGSLYGCVVTGNPVGVEVSGGIGPVIRNCDLSGNVTTALVNDLTTTFDAANNWWGSASGPSDPSAGAPDQNFGSGAAVSDFVAYRPWLSAAPVMTCDLTVDVPPMLPGAAPDFSIRRVAPNPARGALRVDFALAVAAPARLQVVDIAGRAVETIDLGVLTPGEHSKAINESGALPPGVYLVRLVQSGRSVVRRVILLH